MPYIVTTTRDEYDDWGCGPLKSSVRRAVATLDEALSAAAAELHAHDPARPHALTLTALPAHGGTVGPLPDGTVIEVKHVHAWHDENGYLLTGAEAVDALNARY